MALKKNASSPYPPGFADRLGALIERSGLSVAKLSEKAELTPPVIYAWLKEQGSRPPHRENVERVAQVLGATHAELWGEAPLSAAERTRLLQLESFARRVQELLDEIRPTIDPEPEGNAATAAPQVVYHERGGEVRAEVGGPARRRRGKSA